MVLYLEPTEDYWFKVEVDRLVPDLPWKELKFDVELEIDPL